MSIYSHPEWRKKRESILNERSHKCEKCNSNKNLQVHHKRYVKGRRIWQYSGSELVVLCAKCHRNEHGLSQSMKVCKYKGCEWEIEPKYDYCFRHKQIRADERMDDASKKMEEAHEMVKNLEQIKDVIASGGIDGDRHERLEKQVMQLQVLIQKQNQETNSRLNQSSRQILEENTKKNGLSLFGVFVVVIAAVVITSSYFRNDDSISERKNDKPDQIEEKPKYICFECEKLGISAPMIQRTNSKTGRKFYGCSRFPKCRNSF